MSAPQYQEDVNRGKTLLSALEIISDSGQHIWLPVRGTSMLPLLRDGDSVLLGPSLAGLETGDIVVFQYQGELITHRVLSCPPQNEAVSTKGDNRLTPDPPLQTSDLLGRAIRLRRGERSMPLDTSSWRFLNKGIARVMLCMTTIFSAHPGENLSGIKKLTARLRARLGRGVLWALSPILRLAQLLVGRWES